MNLAIYIDAAYSRHKSYVIDSTKRQKSKLSAIITKHLAWVYIGVFTTDALGSQLAT
jgi:hypothetical protein